MKSGGKPACPPERQETPQGKERRLGARQSCEPVVQLHAPTLQAAPEHIDADGTKPVGDQQMLATVPGAD